MATSQDILTDIDLRYRNTFTTSQKLVWMNEEQQELFQILEIDESPISFPLQTDVYFYPIPTGVDIDRIKTMTIQVNDADDPDFVELPFRKNDNREIVGYTGYYFSIVGETFFIPNGTVDDRQVYIYMDTQPTEITTSNLNQEPSVPVRYQELLKLGVLKRIAMARKDDRMYNNYLSDYESKVAEMEWKMKLSEPEFRQPIDMMPRRSRFRRNTYDYRYFNS